jgi:hypothetical protein
MNAHVKKTVHLRFFALRQLRRVHHFVASATCKSLVSVINLLEFEILSSTDSLVVSVI